MAEFMVNRDSIKKTQFQKYLGLYLEYMSYINNVYSVNSVTREAAAKIYYELFV